MNSLSSVLSGLFASLLLSFGLLRLAARFDRLGQAGSVPDGGSGRQQSAALRADSCNKQLQDRRSAAFCVHPCSWQPV